MEVGSTAWGPLTLSLISSCGTWSVALSRIMLWRVAKSRLRESPPAVLSSRTASEGLSLKLASVIGLAVKTLVCLLW